MTSDNPFAVVAADVQAAVASITAGLKWFGGEAARAIAWIDSSVPGAQRALAVLFQVADVAATALEAQANAGLADIVANAIAEAGTTVANLISVSGIDLAAKTALSAADVAAVTATQRIAQNAVAVATAKLLGAAAPAASPPAP